MEACLPMLADSSNPEFLLLGKFIVLGNKKRHLPSLHDLEEPMTFLSRRPGFHMNDVEVNEYPNENGTQEVLDFVLTPVRPQHKLDQKFTKASPDDVFMASSSSSPTEDMSEDESDTDSNCSGATDRTSSYTICGQEIAVVSETGCSSGLDDDDNSSAGSDTDALSDDESLASSRILYDDYSEESECSSGPCDRSVGSWVSIDTTSFSVVCADGNGDDIF